LELQAAIMATAQNKSHARQTWRRRFKHKILIGPQLYRIARLG